MANPISQFYPSKATAQVTKDIWFRSFDMHVAKWEFLGQAVYATTGTKFTPVVAPSWVTDQLKSTAFENWHFVDDDGDLASVKVDSNATTYVTVTPANAKKVKDGLTASVTDGATYDCYCLTGNINSAHGDFFGYTVLGGFAPGIEVAELLTGVPEVKIRKDISGVKPVLKGTAQIIGVPALKTFLRMKEYGLQTGQTSLYTGNDIDIGGFWQVKLIGKNTNGQTLTGKFWKCNLSMDGEMNLGAKEYKTVGFMADVLINDMVEDAGANMYGWEIGD